MKIPLAWLQVSREKIRLLVAMAGIGFADILMFMQLGFQSALFESATRFHQNLTGDLVLLNPQSEALYQMKQFSRRRLYQTLRFEEVQSVAAIYIDSAQWKNPQNSKTNILYVIAANPAQTILNFPDVNQNLDRLKLEDTVLFDIASRPEFGTAQIERDFKKGKVIKTELNRQEIKISGIFVLGASFAANGNVILSDINFKRIFPERDLGRIDIGLVKLKPGNDLETVKQALNQQLGEDVTVLTRQEFVDLEKNYWNRSTPIGFIFALGAGMGFVVGTVIVYQILYSDISDHLHEYATLKAIGYTDRYLLIVVFQEALILAVLGYVPGLTISLGLYSLTKAATKLPMIMYLSRAVAVLVLTIIMCFFSGMIAVQRLRDADPADIF